MTDIDIDVSAASWSLSEVQARRILQRCLDGQELSVKDAHGLLTLRSDDFEAVIEVANRLRREQVGDEVTYVVNRNINFTNVCIKGCQFCAFARGARSEEGYFLDQNEVVRRAVEAHAMGATEVCLQAGLAPDIGPTTYVQLVDAVKTALPDLHIHAFSPEEVKYGSQLNGVSVCDYLTDLRSAGLGSIPGTSAEILDDGIRARISKDRIDSAAWVNVIRSAHELGIPTSSTMMFGHVERPLEQIRHMELIRRVQHQTGGFTEFVPLSFIPTHTRMFTRGRHPDLRPGPSWDEVVRVHSIARLMLGATVKNIQASWVKEGLAGAGSLLDAGANDLGGTLINESISTSAGAPHGQLAKPSQLKALAKERGRSCRQRNTLYGRLDERPGATVVGLEGVDPAERRFGSYAELVAEPAFGYRRRRVAGTPEALAPLE
jgi:7,8-didemethyl-8-hydroxy-5-deazariboflavin synthase CofH subunit